MSLLYWYPLKKSFNNLGVMYEEATGPGYISTGTASIGLSSLADTPEAQVNCGIFSNNSEFTLEEMSTNKLNTIFTNDYKKYNISAAFWYMRGHDTDLSIGPFTFTISGENITVKYGNYTICTRTIGTSLYWVHVAICLSKQYNSNIINYTLYIDGDKATSFGTFNKSSISSVTFSPVHIVTHSKTSYLYDIRLYDSTLSLMEIYDILFRTPVIHYDFEDLGEDFASDSSGLCNDGPITGNVLLSEYNKHGKYGADFSSANYITFPEVQYNIASVWVSGINFASSVAQCIYSDINYGTGISIRGRNIICSNSKIATIPSKYSTNDLLNIVLVNTNSSNMKCFVNGELITLANSTSTTYDLYQALPITHAIGWHPKTSAFTGHIHDFALYDFGYINRETLPELLVEKNYKRKASISKNGTFDTGEIILNETLSNPQIAKKNGVSSFADLICTDKYSYISIPDSITRPSTNGHYRAVFDNETGKYGFLNLSDYSFTENTNLTSQNTTILSDRVAIYKENILFAENLHEI